MPADIEFTRDIPGRGALSHFWPLANKADLVLWSLTFLPPVLLVMAVALQPWVPAGDLLRDPLAVAARKTSCCKFYLGALSTAGVLVWASCTAVCLFAGTFLAFAYRNIDAGVFLLAAGFLTGLLALDDVYLFHDQFLPSLGISERMTYSAYCVLGMTYLMLSWRQILRHRYWMLVAAVALLGTSVAIDTFYNIGHPSRIVFEDGAKFMGIFAWTSFHVTAAWHALRQGGVPRDA